MIGARLGSRGLIFHGDIPVSIQLVTFLLLSNVNQLRIGERTKKSSSIIIGKIQSTYLNIITFIDTCEFFWKQFSFLVDFKRFFFYLWSQLYHFSLLNLLVLKFSNSNKLMMIKGFLFNFFNSSDNNGIRTHNHLVCKQTLNHLAKWVKRLSCVLSTYL